MRVSPKSNTKNMKSVQANPVQTMLPKLTDLNQQSMGTLPVLKVNIRRKRLNRPLLPKLTINTKANSYRPNIGDVDVQTNEDTNRENDNASVAYIESQLGGMLNESRDSSLNPHNLQNRKSSIHPHTFSPVHSKEKSATIGRPTVDQMYRDGLYRSDLQGSVPRKAEAYLKNEDLTGGIFPELPNI